MRTLLTALICAVLSATAYATTAPAAQAPLVASRAALPDFAALMELAQPSVVKVRVKHKAAPGAEEESQGHGSGFVIDAEGLILTNAHVVKDATEIKVTLASKKELTAKLVGADERTDIALLKAETATKLPIAALGNPSKLRVGDWVGAVGSPFGLDNTLTAGIVSAKNRTIAGQLNPFIQSDVAINPGNSGGPLLTLAGEVIGINSQIYSKTGGYMGVAFAIPIDVAMRVADELKIHKKVVRSRIGVGLQPVTPDVSPVVGLETDTGVLVNHVEPGSPAEKAHLRIGDVILAVNGTDVEDVAEAQRYVSQVKPGHTVRLTLWRDKEKLELSVGTIDESTTFEKLGVDEKLGLATEILLPAEAKKLGLAGGLQVIGVKPKALAAQAGLKPKDIIVGVGAKPVTTLDDWRDLLTAGKPARVLVRVWRNGQYALLPLTLKAANDKAGDTPASTED